MLADCSDAAAAAAAAAANTITVAECRQLNIADTVRCMQVTFGSVIARQQHLHKLARITRQRQRPLTDVF